MKEVQTSSKPAPLAFDPYPKVMQNLKCQTAFKHSFLKRYYRRYYRYDLYGGITFLLVNWYDIFITIFLNFSDCSNYQISQIIYFLLVNPGLFFFFLRVLKFSEFSKNQFSDYTQIFQFLRFPKFSTFSRIKISQIS